MEGAIVYDVPHWIAWDWRIAVDLFLGGVGVGAFLVAAVFSLKTRDRYPDVSRVGAVIAPLSVGLGLCFLITELGHPFRLQHTVLGFNPSSPLSWGGPFQGAFLALAFAYAVLWVRPMGPPRLKALVAIVGIVFALLLGTYHGWLLAAVRGRPFWNSGPGTLSALLAAGTSGCAAILLGLCLMRRRAPTAETGNQNAAVRADRSKAIRRVCEVLVACAALQAIVLGIWWAALQYGPANARAALDIANSEVGDLFWLVGGGIGLGVPMLLYFLAVASRHPMDRGPGRLLASACSLAVLVSGLAFRYAWIIAGQIS